MEKYCTRNSQDQRTVVRHDKTSDWALIVSIPVWCELLRIVASCRRDRCSTSAQHPWPKSTFHTTLCLKKTHQLWNDITQNC